MELYYFFHKLFKSKIEPKIGEVFTVAGIDYVCELDKTGAVCGGCYFCHSPYCERLICTPIDEKIKKLFTFLK